MSKYNPIKNVDYIINYYDIMEIPEDSTIDQIKKAYKKLSHEYHPDKFQTAGVEIQEQSKRKYGLIVEGYKIISNEKTKDLYDNQLAIFKEKYPNSISENGYAILDMTRELIDLDFLLTDNDKYEDQEKFEKKIEQLSGYSPVTFNVIQNAYNLNPTDENLRKSYLEVLVHKNAYLNAMEKNAYKAIGVLNKKESTSMTVDGYLDHVESEIQNYYEKLEQSIDVRLLSVDEQPLLIGMDKHEAKGELTDIHKVVSEKMKENFEKNKAQVLKIAQEKKELLDIYVRMRSYAKIHENKSSESFDVVLHEDNEILGVFRTVHIQGDDWEPIVKVDHTVSKVSDLTEFDITTYKLENNPEISLTLYLVEFIQDVVNKNI